MVVIFSLLSYEGYGELRTPYLGFIVARASDAPIPLCLQSHQKEVLSLQILGDGGWFQQRWYGKKSVKEGESFTLILLSVSMSMQLQIFRGILKGSNLKKKTHQILFHIFLS